MSWGQMITMSFVPCSRRGLLAYVYNSVFVWITALVAGNGSYIVRPCGHDLHGPTERYITEVWAMSFLTTCLDVKQMQIEGWGENTDDWAIRIFTWGVNF